MTVDDLIDHLEAHKEMYGNNRVIILDINSRNESEDIEVYDYKNTFLLLAE